MSIPKDPVILLSYINTMLRDNYSSLDNLCKSLSLDKHYIVNQLANINYTYNSHLNKFV